MKAIWEETDLAGAHTPIHHQIARSLIHRLQFAMSSFRLRISNARQIVQVCSAGERLKAGASQNDVTVVTHASLVVARDGRVAAVGSAESVARWLDAQPQPVTFDADIDGRELCVLPGFVDAHTHPVWSGSRVGEFAMKLAGATYMQVRAQCVVRVLVYPLVAE